MSTALPRRVVSRARRELRRAARRMGLGPAANEAPTTQRTRVAAVLGATVPEVGSPTRPGLRVATAVGARLAASLAWEAEIHPVTDEGSADGWEHDPALVLIEVDNGVVPGWTSERVGRLAELAAEARARSVPVHVWVTGSEVAGELAPDVQRLLASADRVWLADPACVAEWRSRLPGASVDVLLPAVQPRLHRPGPAGQLRPAVACVLLDPPAPAGAAPDAIDPLLAAPLPRSVASILDVWPQLDDGGRERAVPDSLTGRVAERVDVATATAVLSAYRTMLDAGRGTAASTWSVLEAAASQTAVVTDRTRAETLPPDLRDLVSVAEAPADLPGVLVANVHQPELRDRDGLRLQRAVLRGHTIGHRLDDMLRASGPTPRPRPEATVSAVVPTNREHELDNILSNLGRQAHDQVQLVLVLHNLDVDEASLRAQAKDAGIDDLVVRNADASLTLGACMNLGVDASDGRYIAKMDDDNYYGAHYLGDLLATFDYSDAQIAGKWAHYVWLRSTGAVVLRHATSEHTYERRIQGGSMLFDGDLVRSLRFSDIPRAVDSDILDRAMAAGAKVYSADRFNFVSIRGTDREAHTWTVADYTFMTPSGQLAFYGDPREHVDV